jgi:fructokinase
VERLVSYFGKALATVVNILDPHAIVLGGGVSNVDLLYTRGVEAMKPWVFNDRFLTRVVKNELGDSAGVFGAAMLVA